MPRKLPKPVATGPLPPPEAQVRSGKASLRLLSEHLALSRATISLVLNDAPLARRLSPQTRERVLQAAEAFGYRPNYFARSLSGKRSFLIGVIAPDFSEGYDAAILSGVERRLLDSEYTYFVSSHLWSRNLLERNVRTLVDRGIEGLLFINTPVPASASVPSVAIGASASAPGVSLFHIDNGYGIYLAVKHLVELGHTRIAFFKGHEDSSDTEARWCGVKEACKSMNLNLHPDLAIQLDRIGTTGDLGIDEGQVAAQKLLKSRRHVTALVAFNDISAIGAMSAFRNAGLRLPEDVSVVGFDDISLAKVAYPMLTTIRQPLREMGEHAADKLVQQIEGRAAAEETICMKPELIIRRSTAPCIA